MARSNQALGCGRRRAFCAILEELRVEPQCILAMLPQPFRQRLVGSAPLHGNRSEEYVLCVHHQTPRSLAIPHRASITAGRGRAPLHEYTLQRPFCGHVVWLEACEARGKPRAGRRDYHFPKLLYRACLSLFACRDRRWVPTDTSPGGPHFEPNASPSARLPSRSSPGHCRSRETWAQ